jgi:hypothetical protein
MLTPEARQKAQAARKAKREAGADFRRDWADSETWDRLAEAKGIRLPL